MSFVNANDFLTAIFFAKYHHGHNLQPHEEGGGKELLLQYCQLSQYDIWSAYCIDLTTPTLTIQLSYCIN
jgi:hypothetical protein